jgi:hypothetical protein
MYLLERRTVLQAIAAKITPFVGATMATASAAVHSEKLGITGERVSAAEFEQLLKRVGSGLVIFIGHERSQKVMDEIRAELVGQRGAL